MCTELLEVIHGARRELLPTPDEVLDRTVESWIRRAGSLAYECPGADGDLERVSSAMQKLAELEAEIDAALRLRAGAVAS